ncbi:hypothetical protein AOQ84DRAFT_130837 [Glonium stellatum]|uniref:Altered inheritance of mitochondria protein 6 n=1 Tax=Glonium stellatum TaxID=574774 RepID=A0A8E2JXM9_9PEZI|nr:hypothetical protein AOQ84DRAFT_130837 [Glonium stellatum]
MPVDPFDAAFDPFRRGPGPISVDSPYYPTHYLQSVLPVPCHSHNDYWRRTPLYAALGSGCVSIEADVWLFRDQEDELYVGHSVASLSRNATLRNLYVDPLVSILERMNSENEIAGPIPGLRGVFYQDPEQPLTLLIDFKTNGLDLWPYLQAQLAPLRDRGWLTHWNGTDRVTKLVTVVATGNAPFEALTANKTYRDVFFDAPLDDLDDASDPPSALPGTSENSVFDFKYNPSNSHMASAPFLRALSLSKLSYSVPPVFQGPLTPPQTAILRKQIGQARERGLLPRYWGTPRWPRGLRDRVWEVLVEEGVGLLNVDDLRAARKGQWGRPH